MPLDIIKNNDGLPPWDVAEVCWYEAADNSILPAEYRRIGKSLASGGCILLTGTSKRNSNDFVATQQILYHADIAPLKWPASTMPQSNVELYVFNSWTTNRFFSNRFGNIEMRGDVAT
jgi:hypothetical protein